MNRRNQEIVSDEELLAHLKKNYIYDAERGVVMNRKLNRVVKGSNDTQGYKYTCIRLKGQHLPIRLHRLVWVLVYGRFPTQIDHINGVETDNRIENLREVSAKENADNRVWAWKPNSRTGLPGVYKDGSDFRICNLGVRFFFHDKYEAFQTLINFGRMFKS